MKACGELSVVSSLLLAGVRLNNSSGAMKEEKVTEVNDAEVVAKS